VEPGFLPRNAALESQSAPACERGPGARDPFPG
jgi:hypothetical protein